MTTVTRPFGEYATSLLGAVGPAGAGALTPDDPLNIGPFQLLGILGEGGMGRVYLGRSDGDHLVAVKVVHRERYRDPGFRARFEREVKLAYTVDGNYTAKVVAADTISATQWVATEYISGPTLDQFLRTEGKLGSGVGQALALGLAQALDSIHSRGVVHRDLTPRNIIIGDDGPRIIDFGIGKAVGFDGGTETFTAAGFGTLPWMAPERVQSPNDPVTPAVDIYSWGVIVCQALTGQHPFHGVSDYFLPAAALNQEPDLKGLPLMLAPGVAKALSARPADRHTARQIVDALLNKPRASTDEVVTAVTQGWRAPVAQQKQSERPAPVTPGRPGGDTREVPAAAKPGPARPSPLARAASPAAAKPAPRRSAPAAAALAATPASGAPAAVRDTPGQAAPRKGKARRWIAAAAVSGALLFPLGLMSVSGVTASADSRDVHVKELFAGDCVNDSRIGQSTVSGINKVEVVPCDAPHDGEVTYASSTHFEDLAWPGEADLARYAKQACQDQFTIRPNYWSWIVGGDRFLVCIDD